jgi:hypothetical protein
MARRAAVVVIVIIGAVLAGASPAFADQLSIEGATPASAPPGTNVVIAGRGFSSTTSVLFNGSAATFTVNTAKKITAKVPPNASTGPITITRSRPAATVTSTFDFIVTLPPDTSPWPMFQQNPQHTGKSTSAGPSTTTVQSSWTYKAPSWVRNEPTVAPDGTVMIGQSGKPLCGLSSVVGTANFCSTVGGQTAQSSAAIGNPFMKTDAQGTRKVQTVYMGDRNNIFWAFDSEGKALWFHKINLDGDVRASPIIAPDPSNRIYAMCGCTTRGVLHAFDKSGSLQWFINLPSQRDTSPAGVQFGSHFRLYVISNNAELTAIDDMGSSASIAWTIDLGSQDEHSSPTIGPDGTIYVGTDNKLFAVKDNGASAVVKPGWPLTVAGEVDTTAALSGNTLYVSSHGPGTVRTMYGVDLAGPSVLWSRAGVGTSSTNLAQTPSPVIGANGLVYAAIGPNVFAFDPAVANPATTPRWQYTLGDDAISLAVGEGALYVSAKDSKVYALVPGP